MMSGKSVLLGSGGHAAVLLDAVRAAGVPDPVGLLARSEDARGSSLFGIPVIGTDESLPELAQQGVSGFLLGIGTDRQGRTTVRERVFEKALRTGLTPVSVIHPTAWISASAQLGAGIQVFPYALVHSRSMVGTNVIINSGAIVEHDCEIGDHAHIAPRACLCGGVHLGASSHVGAGAVVLQGVRIGPRACIGAGAVVVQDVPAGATVVGVPARGLKHAA